VSRHAERSSDGLTKCSVVLPAIEYEPEKKIVIATDILKKIFMSL
jgi:hypothetical protein